MSHTIITFNISKGGSIGVGYERPARDRHHQEARGIFPPLRAHGLGFMIEGVGLKVEGPWLRVERGLLAGSRSRIYD